VADAPAKTSGFPDARATGLGSHTALEYSNLISHERASSDCHRLRDLPRVAQVSAHVGLGLVAVRAFRSVREHRIAV